MTSRDDDRSLREAFASLAGDARSGDGCPPPQRLWAAIEGEAAIEQRQELIDHIATCPSCAADWRAAYQMGARPPAGWRTFFRRWAGAKLSSEGSFTFPIPGLGGGAVAMQRRVLLSMATVLALVLTVYILVPSSPPPPFRGIQSALPANVPLDRENCWLRWKEQEGAIYNLTVTTDSLEPVVTVQGLQEPQYLLREKELAKVSADDRLLWLVEATLPSGQRITSQTFVSTLQ